LLWFSSGVAPRGNQQTATVPRFCAILIDVHTLISSSYYKLCGSRITVSVTAGFMSPPYSFLSSRLRSKTVGAKYDHSPSISIFCFIFIVSVVKSSPFRDVVGKTTYHYTESDLSQYQQEAQLPQRDRAMLPVILKITQGHSK